ncbi:MAG: nucleoside deaminase [Sedimentisphaerales bacterium]|nr:nucleoside deaminase [Sedimentisphaerales bacterium]
MAKKYQLTLALPDWVGPVARKCNKPLLDDERRMEFVLSLVEENIARKTGGPFAAAVFAQDTGKLISVGVNIVQTSNCSITHAEMMALSLAQQSLGSYDLALVGEGGYELVSSTEPCAMCLGALAWSGIVRLVCGARDNDARAIGFDEGDKPNYWMALLERRGIKVIEDVLRDKSVELLQLYAEEGGEIYNSKQS